MIMRLFVDKSKCSVRHIYRFQFFYTKPLEELIVKNSFKDYRVHYLLFDGTGIVNCFHLKTEY